MDTFEDQLVDVIHLEVDLSIIPHVEAAHKVPVVIKGKLTGWIWHLKLGEDSSHLTTFATPFGHFQRKVLPFGIAPVPEIFQKALHNNISDLEGMVNKPDHLVVRKGKTMEEAIGDHGIMAKMSGMWDMIECQENGSMTNLSIFHGLIWKR